jgi:hypothetical protein
MGSAYDYWSVYNFEVFYSGTDHVVKQDRVILKICIVERREGIFFAELARVREEEREKERESGQR